jgi:hypothetical protein
LFVNVTNNGPLPLPFIPPPASEEKEFDWHFCTAELENTDSYILIDILRDVTVPISTLVDENGLTLIHHAVLKGVDGKV